MNSNNNIVPPANLGGSSFEDIVLKFKGDVAFTSTTLTANLLPFSIGVVGFIGFIYLLFIGSYFGGVFIGAILIGTAYALFRFRPYLEIDRAAGELRIYRNKRDKEPAEIHAFGQKVQIQTIKKFIPGQGTAPGFNSTELNIVTASGKTICILDHAKSSAIKKSELSLRQFLNLDEDRF